MCKSKAVFVSERGKESGTGDQQERRRRTQARGEGGRKKKSGKASEFTRGLERKKVRRREERKGKRERETERKSKRGGWESVTVKRVRACDLSMMMLLLLVCV